MPLLENEINPGTVAFLDPAALYENAAVNRSDDKHVFRPGPFLCVAEHEGTSTWLNITSQRDRRGLRLELRSQWRLEGSHLWRKSPQFINDARKPFIGPNEAFVAASHKERDYHPNLRPQISVAGVEAAILEIERYRSKSGDPPAGGV